MESQKIYIASYHKTGTIKPINWYTMLTKKQLNLLQSFIRNTFKEYSLRELGRVAKEKSNNAVQLALKQFLKEEIVTSHRVGTSKLFSLNFDNDKLYDYFTLLKYEGLPKTVIQSIVSLKEQIDKYTLFYSLVIFGSYAVGEQNKDSDLDIAIILPDDSQTNNMKIVENIVKRKSLLPLHIQIITQKEMFEMLTNKEENVGKEIARKHKAVHNINIFYKIVRGAVNNGFRY